MNRSLALLSCLLLGAWTQGVPGQGQPPPPKPFPRPGQPPATAPAKPGAEQSPAKPSSQPAASPQAPAIPGTPTEATLGLPVYPASQFITSYDAGRGQRFYLFGTTASFTEVVAYYRSVLKQRGELVFEEPPTHMFEVGRFREETMGFPPGITVKDYTWGGMTGYTNPKPGGKPARFPTLVQVVPAPSGSGGLPPPTR
jgi:hypothetical protein